MIVQCFVLRQDQNAPANPQQQQQQQQQISGQAPPANPGQPLPPAGTAPPPATTATGPPQSGQHDEMAGGSGDPAASEVGETGDVEFPLAELAKLDEMINRPRWVVPVLPRGELEVLLDAAIDLCKKSMQWLILPF